MKITYRTLDASVKRRHVVVADGVDQEAFANRDDAVAYGQQLAQGYDIKLTEHNMTAEAYRNATQGNG